jgi:hypothetical protein
MRGGVGVDVLAGLEGFARFVATENEEAVCWVCLEEALDSIKVDFLQKEAHFCSNC